MSDEMEIIFIQNKKKDTSIYSRLITSFGVCYAEPESFDMSDCQIYLSSIFRSLSCLLESSQDEDKKIVS